MLRLLLDEHISPTIAEQLKVKRPKMEVISLQEWGNGGYLGMSDEVILTSAMKEGLTLVTYDQRTIAPLIKLWSEEGKPHGGVIFIDWRTLAPHNFGGLVKALCTLWDAQADVSWTDRALYLKAVAS